MLCWEDPPEKEMAIHSGILAWEIPWTEEPGILQPKSLQKSLTWLRTKQKFILRKNFKLHTICIIFTPISSLFSGFNLFPGDLSYLENLSSFGESRKKKKLILNLVSPSSFMFPLDSAWKLNYFSFNSSVYLYFIISSEMKEGGIVNGLPGNLS